MTSHQPKQWPLFTRLIPVVLLCLMAVYNSCKKNDLKESSLPVSNPVINEAKIWYETAYSVNTINKPLQVNSSGVETDPDLSQKIKPDWQRNTTYKRFNQDVIEMPIDASSKYNPALQNATTNKLITNPAYSRSSFLLLKNGNKREAYIMTIIADSSYLKNDLTKLDRNKYNKRDTNFSGLVLYLTPNGKYVSGWRYKNGHLLTSQNNKGSTDKDVQNVGSKIKIATATTIDCWDYYLYDRTNSTIIRTFLFRLCSTTEFPGGGDPETSGGYDDGSTPSPVGSTPPPCPQSAAKIIINGNAPPSDDTPIGEWGDGFPPPAPQTPTTCTVSAPPTDNPEITISIKDPCIKKMVKEAIKLNIKYSLEASMNTSFNTNTDFNLDFIDDPLSSDIDGITNVIRTSGEFDQQNNRYFSITGMDLRITLNSTVLPGAAQEFITATIIHESLHAYLRTQNIGFSHFVMYQEYLPAFISALKSVHPALSDFDAKSLALGGLTAGTGYMSGSDVTMLNNYLNKNTAYRESRSGTPCN